MPEFGCPHRELQMNAILRAQDLTLPDDPALVTGDSHGVRIIH
jgi:hypothetical protein